MESFGVYVSVIMLLLKLTKDISLCVSLNDTTNSTLEKAIMYKEVNVDTIVTSAVPTLDSDRTKMYPKVNTETTAGTSDPVLHESTKGNLPNNTDKTTTTKTILSKKSVNVTDNTDQNESDTNMNNETYQNNKTKTMTIDSAQTDNESNPFTHKTTTTTTTKDINDSSNEKEPILDNSGTVTFVSNSSENKSNRPKTSDKTWNFNGKTFTSYTILNNSGNAIHAQISPWTTQCVENCTCFKDISNLGSHFDPPIKLNTRMKIVNCTACAYYNVPMKVPTETDVLYLNDNGISKLNHFPYLPKLIYLDVSNNHVKMINNYRLFSQVQKLKHLILFNNQLKTLEPGSFSGLISLDNLDLGFNQISSIHPHAFVGLNHLKMLNLRGNRLTNISTDWFKAVFDIRELDLSQNLLNVIEANILSPLTNLYSLDFANNKIRSIDLEAFRGLEKLKMLNLSNNQIMQVPTYQLRCTKSLGKVILNGNPLTRIKSGDFFHLNITSVSVSYMENLLVIERLAFHALPMLESLFAHDNQKLIYIDHNAFSLVPNLQRLYIHNNELSAISPSMLDFLPNLEEMHLYHNPLRCDCNAFWVKELLESAKQTNYSKPYFNHSQFIKCGSPLNVTGRSITEVNEDFFSRVCAPTTLQLFSDKYQLDLGEELRLECHAFGVPDPSITWSLPNGTIIDPSMQRNRIIKPSDKISVIDDCVLIVKHLSTKDSGTYSCKSDNGFGYDISSTRVSVSNKPVRLFPYTVNSNYISISWNGTQHKSMISDYQLHYREVAADDSYLTQVEPENPEVSIIQLGPQYHSYTVTKLKPLTKYEFCLVYLYKQKTYKVDCRNISTHAQSGSGPGIQKLVSDKLVIGICTAIGLIILLTCIIMLVKKFCGQKEYEHPYDSDESETINIPLDNLYQPLSVPICSSKTSLLSKHLD